MSVRFVKLDEVLKIQQHQINMYGGEHGVRDLALLESAVSQPKAMYSGDYLHISIFDKAAAYLFHLSQNHPFVDDNKRVGIVTAQYFLLLNGYELIVDIADYIKMVLGVAQGDTTKEQISTFLEKNSIKLSDRI